MIVYERNQAGPTFPALPERDPIIHASCGIPEGQAGHLVHALPPVLAVAEVGHEGGEDLERGKGDALGGGRIPGARRWGWRASCPTPSAKRPPGYSIAPGPTPQRVSEAP